MIKVICTNCGDTIVDEEVYCNECRDNAKDSIVAHGLVKFFADNYGLFESYCPVDCEMDCPNNKIEYNDYSGKLYSVIDCEYHRRVAYICWIQSYTGLSREECMKLIGD